MDNSRRKVDPDRIPLGRGMRRKAKSYVSTPLTTIACLGLACAEWAGISGAPSIAAPGPVGLILLGGVVGSLAPAVVPILYVICIRSISRSNYSRIDDVRVIATLLTGLSAIYLGAVFGIIRRSLGLEHAIAVTTYNAGFAVVTWVLILVDKTRGARLDGAAITVLAYWLAYCALPFPFRL